MKKAVSIILIILPVFLMVSISLAARVMLLLVPVAVEDIEFIDDDGQNLNRITLALNEEYTLLARVLPQNASNQNFYFEIEDNDVCLLGRDGQIIAASYGECTVYAVSEQKKRRAELKISVRDNAVVGVELNYTDLILNIGESFELKAKILPSTALNKKVTWHSSDSEKVSVSQNGLLRAKAETVTDTPVTISVVTHDGEYRAECLVTVVPDLPPLAFYRTNDLFPLPSGDTLVVTSSQIDLMDYIRFDSELIDAENISFTILAGAENGKLDESILTFTKPGKSIRIRAEAVGRDGKTYKWESPFRQKIE